MSTAPVDNNNPAAARILNQEPFQDQLALKNRALDSSAEGITISDPAQPDNPLIFANDGFERLTGYAVSDVLGKNCRFLQGPGTDQAEVDKIRQAIREEREVTVELLNYRKHGTPFWNRLSITPVRNDAGKTTHFIGVQSDVTARRNAEEALRQANHQLGVVNRRMKRDLDAAARIQRALLPSALPESERVTFAWTFRPCDELAGDILNVFRLDDDHIGLYLLDVSGHGVPAALLSVTLSRWLSPMPGQSCLLTSAPDGSGQHALADPVDVANQLNRRFPLEQETPQFFTFAYGVLDTRALAFRYVLAGHPPPLRIAQDGHIEQQATGGPPIGVVPQPGYQASTIRLRKGDRLVMYTDGIIEALDANDESFGLDRLLQSLRDGHEQSLQDSLEHVMGQAEEWSHNSQFIDDASMLALEVG